MKGNQKEKNEGLIQQLQRWKNIAQATST